MRIKAFRIKSWFAANRIDVKFGKNQTDDTNQHDPIFHKLTLGELAVLFNTSLTCGLTDTCAQQLLIKNGKNCIKQKSKNIFWRLVSYLFTGFCGLLWISSLICLLAWKPIGKILLVR
jgi:hypothetical protein